uniref:GATA transcription factor 8-like n=1 Tax=Erigeron canadensis TaxID=72917 RepID=UPI001CB96985|nr:GATA transcription factor 8-like [Erigeron canadensis]XP_043616538.1 GATA transcription factor 8-like [Erigeron canadensis]
MAEETFIEEIDCGSYFDHIEDLIDFPPVTDETSLNVVDCNDFADIWTKNSDELQASDPIFSDNNCASSLSAELAVPYEDIVQLEWLSAFVEESFSGGGMTMNKDIIPVKKEEPLVVSNYQFQMSSPVSVLESSSSSSSSSSCSGGNKMIGLTQRGPQRARSKRPRPPTFNPRAAIELLSPSTLVTVPISVESESLDVSHNSPKSGIVGPEQKKRKKKPKKEALFHLEDENQNQTQTGQAVRKCLHCEITKTPQWRAGPMGPKTLCNACGVRYKSGRLYPEYRPAASPTFVPTLHSNSHKKVVEMRTKCIPNDVMVKLPKPEPKLIPNMNPPANYM